MIRTDKSACGRYSKAAWPSESIDADDDAGLGLGGKFGYPYRVAPDHELSDARWVRPSPEPHHFGGGPKVAASS